MSELQQLFRAAVPDRIAALKAAAAAADHAGVRRLAHALRGSGGTYGFPAVSAAAAAVEHADPAQLEARLDGLLAVLDEAARAEDAERSGIRQAPQAPSPADEVPAPPVTAAHGLRGRVLLVDDDAEIRLLAGFVLEQHGFLVQRAADADSAFAALRDCAPDVLLVDVMLGEDDGVDVARRLAARCAVPPAIVFLTGAVDDRTRARMMEAGAGDIVAKPFDPDALPALVARHVEVAP